MFARIQQQVASEIAGANKTPAHFYGFFGACCNWFLGLSAVYDASCKGPEVISLKMSCVMLCDPGPTHKMHAHTVHLPLGALPIPCAMCGTGATRPSSAGGRAGPSRRATTSSQARTCSTSPRRWKQPSAHPPFPQVEQPSSRPPPPQLNQLRRCLEYKAAEGGEEAKAEIAELGQKAAVGAQRTTRVHVPGLAGVAVLTLTLTPTLTGLAGVAVLVAGHKPLKAALAPIGPAYLSSPAGPSQTSHMAHCHNVHLPLGALLIPRTVCGAGPFTIHPWPPVTKILISGASLLEFDRPTDKISLSQYTALTITGALFSR